VNLLQTVVETLLFYHPVVGWVSRDIRKERELCCDDAAVRACGDPLHYARALADLAVLRNSNLALAQGMDGGELTLRVERLIGPHGATAGTFSFAPVLLASALCFAGIWAVTSMPRPLQTLRLPTLQLPVRSLFKNSAPNTLSVQPALAEAQTQVPLRRTHVRVLARVEASPAVALQTQNALSAEPMALVTAPVDTAPQTDKPAAASPAEQGYDPNLYSSAPLKVITVHHLENDPPTAPSKPRHQDRCEPLTGYRVCNQ
jgi:hypothetical protein